MDLEELQVLYNSLYPTSKINLSKEDWAICNINVESNNVQNIIDYLEKVNNRINISKSNSLQTSETFINRLIKNLQPYQKEIYGYIEPFCESETQGLMLSLFNSKTSDELYIWSCELKNSKDIMILTSNEKDSQNLYLIKDLDKAQYFSKNNFSDAIDYSLKQIDMFLDKSLNINI